MNDKELKILIDTTRKFAEVREQFVEQSPYNDGYIQALKDMCDRLETFLPQNDSISFFNKG